MASKALSKETRAIVSTKTSAVRKRMTEANFTDKLAVAGGGTLGASTAAVLDGFDVAIPVGDKTRIPISPILAVGGVVTGLAMGRGTFAAAALGFGMGNLDAFLYSRIRQAIEDRDK